MCVLTHMNPFCEPAANLVGKPDDLNAEAVTYFFKDWSVSQYLESK